MSRVLPGPSPTVRSHLRHLAHDDEGMSTAEYSQVCYTLP